MALLANQNQLIDISRTVVVKGHHQMVQLVVVLPKLSKMTV